MTLGNYLLYLLHCYLVEKAEDFVRFDQKHDEKDIPSFRRCILFYKPQINDAPEFIFAVLLHLRKLYKSRIEHLR